MHLTFISKDIAPTTTNIIVFNITMKFQVAALVVSVALLPQPQASAFAPAAFSASKSSVGGGVRSANVFLNRASAMDDEEEYLDKEGGHDAWSKLIKMKDFDPDEEDDEELVKEVLDATAAALEIEEVGETEESTSIFKSALSIVRLLREQVGKKKSLDFVTYSNHPEVSCLSC